jgi:hypothetical protein
LYHSLPEAIRCPFYLVCLPLMLPGILKTLKAL